MSILDTPVLPSPLDNLVADENAYSAAYDAVKDELAAMQESDIVYLNVEINAATTTVLGAMPEILALRPALATLPDFDVTSLDRLERYASATTYLHLALQTQGAPSPDLAALLEEATKMRDSFVADATALVKRGLLDEVVLSERPRGTGHRNLAMELLSLTMRLRNSWDRINGRSGLQFPEFARAEAICMRIQRHVGLREQAGPGRKAALTLERAKAFTVLHEAYDDVRRAVTYLRWKEGDVDSIAPSLYAGRGGSKKKGSDETPTSDSAARASDADKPDASGTTSSGSVAAPAGPPSFSALDPNDPLNNAFGST